MGAQKKCHLLISTIISFLFCLFITYLFLDEYFISEKSKKKSKKDNNIFWCALLLIISILIWLYLLYKTFKQDIKIKLISKKKSSSEINIINRQNQIFDDKKKNIKY